ncbi:7-cyano-7-deazaguanine synthase QueC [Piscinibacter koreensis]|uniref:7-cyano-7-deazaguanine synthase n=1 Tax=Piscinibacter koreensis TaxID=2742824 RepID=A0A7Y6NK39_9BURK|nr:7-cyano-7-deazaguanine synthase QueC [Schlegelella koreensis]NUZ04597.1 7-cyano-7-deazaguanine synthase QueC [Schlegelella koreensis]
MTDPRRALVLFSGGQDSTVCLAWALERFAYVETIGFDHSKSHDHELECRMHARMQLHLNFPRWSHRLGDDHLLDLTLLNQIGETRPTDERALAMSSGGLSNSYVPGRNLLFLTFAGTVAERRGLSVLVGGMCETDDSQYPDCRDNSLKALQVAISLGMDTPMTIETPLLRADKAEVWAMTERLGGEPLLELVIEHTHSCFMGDRSRRHPWGYGCGLCPACDQRARGYEAWLDS